MELTATGCSVGHLAFKEELENSQEEKSINARELGQLDGASVLHSCVSLNSCMGCVCGETGWGTHTI